MNRTEFNFNAMFLFSFILKEPNPSVSMRVWAGHVKLVKLFGFIYYTTNKDIRMKFTKYSRPHFEMFLNMQGKIFSLMTIWRKKK